MTESETAQTKQRCLSDHYHFGGNYSPHATTVRN